jgi:hypothetical protein
MTKRQASWLKLLLIVAIVAVYTIRAFFPGEPIHHELNEAGAVLIIAGLVVWVFA